MECSIFKKPPTDVKVTDPRISGKMLCGKIQSWLETEPLILMGGASYSESSAKSYGEEDKKLEIPAGSNWRIEFQFVRAREMVGKGVFDGAVIVAGYIKNTLEMVGVEDGKAGRQLPAYLISLNSRTIKIDNKIFLSAIDLWSALTTFGQMKPKE